MNSKLIATQCLALAIGFLPAIIILVTQKIRQHPAFWRMLGLAVAVFLAYSIVLALPQLAWFDGLHYNWQNKFLAALLTTVVLARCPSDFRVRAGFAWPAGPWAIYTTIAAVVILVIAVWAGLSIDDPRPLTAETLLFQATVPGFDEELIYRGVVFALLGLAFGLQSRNGLWAVLLLTTFLFGLAHGFEWHDDSIKFLPGPFATASIVGFWLGWVRLYTGSIVPAIVLHNLYNVVFNAIASI